MKNLIITTIVVLLAFTVQAQEKDTYVKEGKYIKATIRHDNGTIAQAGFFTKEGALTGQWVSYDRNGNKTAEAQYSNGEKVGTWFFWSDNKLTEVNYTNNNLATVNVWKNIDTSEVVINK